ncbi:TIR domain-containing protein [Chryseobacterium sp. Tr-659]|uniref:toll/interleukin-1 receptor domain-containing protein n=1 Tax=Chryseobacterium sp. Tr-659 TaxID=2608340 RepID=UPI00142325FF|nr:toll/interleukin-1 receptor domain-containing protein [Chryseobacterium sp. Tr-659]NIF06644.1 TIR domain-containing protein [Chryseobacterium sp. Tr-659]
MAKIFLSHIHDEKELALIIKKAIVEEFSGFVEVFVSSDGESITPGANFLKRIEDSLLECVGAIYLISPKSVKRNWINFELGAIWIRNSLSIQNGGPEIPAIPVCHSNIVPSSLPMPLTNLNAISANNSAQLELSFRSIQIAVGGKGNLKTDFDALAKSINEFEQVYTIGDSLVKLFKLFNGNYSQMNDLINLAHEQKDLDTIDLSLGMTDANIIKEVINIEKGNLKEYISVHTTNNGIYFSPSGSQNAGQLMIKIAPKIIIKFESLLKSIY